MKETWCNPEIEELNFEATENGQTSSTKADGATWNGYFILGASESSGN